MPNRTVPDCLLFKIFLSLRIVLPNGTDLGASFLLRAITASLEALAQCALANLAQTVTENGFLSVHPAAITVNVFRENGRIIQFGPYIKDCRGLFISINREFTNQT